MTVRWSLVSTMQGVPETVLPCVAHHLNSDVERVHVYLDAPQPEVERSLRGHPRCIFTLCDAAYWAERPGGRPEGIVRRQLANLRHARRASNSDWLVHVDSDEFLVASDPAHMLHLGAALSRVPEEQEWVRILPMERVLPPAPEPQTIFDGLFRGQSPDAVLIAAAYGPGAPYLHVGMSGHFLGKVGFRRRTKLDVRLHAVRWPMAEQVEPFTLNLVELPPFTTLADVRLLHFDGWSALQWATKLIRLADNALSNSLQRGRRTSVLYMADHPRPEDRLALFRQVQRLTEDGLELLAAAGLLRQVSFDPTPLTRAIFPEVDMDFSISAFNKRLRENDPDFYSRTGL